MTLPAKALRAVILFVLGITAFAQELPPPPTPPTVLTQSKAAKSSDAPIAAASGLVLYSIGNPSDDEQLQLELINRARTNAPAEALRLIGLEDIYVQAAMVKVDTNLMKQQFATNPPVAPLSFNEQLNNAARAHAQYLFDNALQSHEGPGPGDDLGDRMTTAGYKFASAGENVFSYSPNGEVGHAAFEVDWSGQPKTVNGGMQLPAGHRDNIHYPIFTEVGISGLWGTNTVITSTRTNTVGPLLLVQDFARPLTNMNFITGVAYYDINGNNFYDLGEGCGGVKVTVDGVNFYAITTASGGYSIPVATNANYTVRFSASGVPESAIQVAVAAENVKVDFKPPFVVPTVTGVPSITFAGVSNLYSLATLPGATGYRGSYQKLTALPLEGAEGELTNVTFDIWGTYLTLPTAIKASGSRSFRLGHTNGVPFPGVQALTFNKPFYVKAGAKIDFRSRVGVASSNQVARVEVSEDAASWTPIWSQLGTQVNGQANTSELQFFGRTAQLTNYVGKVVYVRFSFSFTNIGTYFPLVGQTSDNGRGWYFDDIVLTNAVQPGDATVVQLASDPYFRFAPPSTGEYLVSAQALNGTREFPWGQERYVAAQANPPTLTLINNPTRSGGSISFQFTVTGTATPYALDHSASPNGPWTHEPGAIFSGPTADRYTVSVPITGGQRFYRVRAN